jgi:hypothetical protein
MESGIPRVRVGITPMPVFLGRHFRRHDADIGGGTGTAVYRVHLLPKER